MASKKAAPLTLTQAAFAMRQIILVGGITVVFLIVGRVFAEAAIQYWQATHPTPPPPPTAGFGVLPRIAFPESRVKVETFRLEAPATALRPPSDRAAVFFQPSQRASLLAVDKANKQANVLGFLLAPDRISTDMYRWRRTSPLPAVLDYNIITGTFTLRVDWQSNPAFLQGNKLPTEDAAIAASKQILANAGLLPKDMATGSAKITYLKGSGTSYLNTVSYSEADFLQVDLFRSPVFGQYIVMTERPNKGTVRAIISGNADRNQQLVALEYSYLPVDYLSFHTYAIITPNQAYTLLSSGKGYTASASENQTVAVIRNIYLAYYDSGNKPQSYLQPIYVFEGDGGYVGYVSAIDPAYLTAQ